MCPITKLPLRVARIGEAADAMARGGGLVARSGVGPRALGATPTVLVREDGRCAYPVLDGVPVLLGPERLVAERDGPLTVDLAAPAYAEAYQEMDFYGAEAEQAESRLEGEAAIDRLRRAADLTVEERRAFPAPAGLWLDATYETTAQWQAYRHLAPLDGKRVLQVGGRGVHAVTLLLAGASEAWVLSPIIGELVYAKALARELGLAGRLHVAAGVAEELPLADGHFDGIYTISLHHTATEVALPECRRVLRLGGVLASVEPWRAPLYRIGTRLLGKREPQVHCRPMTNRRVQPLFRSFPDAEVVHHGTLLRYPMLALWKAGIRLDVPMAWRIARLDDALSSAVPGLRRWGTCAALLARDTGVSG